MAVVWTEQAMAKHYPNITSVSVNPGLVKTGLAAGVQSRVVSGMMAVFPMVYQSPEQGACNTLWAATTAKTNLENGAYYDPVGKKGGAFSVAGIPSSSWGVAKSFHDKALEDKLWEWTEKELKDVKGL